MTRDERVAGVRPRELPNVADGVSLWWCDLELPAEALPRLAATLSPGEHARAARFGRDSLRARWIAGRASLRVVLGGTLDAAPHAVAIARGARGRPQLAGGDADIDFNVSHTAGVALIGVLRRRGRAVRIGVDVERADRDVAAERLARRVLTVDERADLEAHAPADRSRRFLRYWTCKEAMSKATGDGLSAPFRRIDVGLSPGLALREGPEPYRPGRWTLVAASVPDGFIATVALWDRDGFTHRPVSDTSSASAATGNPPGARGSPAPRAARTSP
jgi:4'-phosphopantetheinyl transferase